jgi:SAM-dependent methyltransferase
MHPSALKLGALFFNTYLKDSSALTIVDIGSQDVNGSLHDLSPKNCNYIGVDFVGGKNVDIVLDDPYKLPFEKNSIDVIVCSSVFEHSQFFWVLFLEIVRVLKPEGLLYLNAPSNGYIHRYPVDCWRFYPDSGLALVSWAKLNGYRVGLLESFIGDKNLDIESNETWWNDYCAVFIKDTDFSSSYKNRLLHSLTLYTNAHCDDLAVDSKKEFLTDDFLLVKKTHLELQNLSTLLAESNTEIEGLTKTATSYNHELTLLNNKAAEKDQLYSAELDRLRDDAQASSDRVTENEKIAVERISAMQLAHESQIVEQGRHYDTRERIMQAELAQACKEIDYLRSQIKTHQIQIFEREQKFDEHVQTITSAFVTTKTNLRNEFASRESAYITQLKESTQKIDAFQVGILELEKDSSHRQQDLQRTALIREQAHTAQLLRLSEAFASQIQELKRNNEQHLNLQRDDFNTREKNLWTHLEAEKLRFSILANEWLEKEKIHSLQNDALKQALRAIYTSKFWKLTAPIRRLSDQLPHKPIEISTPDKGLPKIDATSSTYVVTPKRDPLDNPSVPIQHPTTMTSNTVPHTHGESNMNLTEMLSFQNEGFVQNAYHVLLARAADPDGLRHYLARVQKGVSKVEVLIEISLSKEGRKLNVEVAGLKKEIKRYHLLRTPVLGHFFKACGLALVDGKVENNVRVIENKLVNLEATMSQQIGQLMQAVIAGNQKSSNQANTNRLVIRPQVNHQPPVLRTPPQIVKVVSSTPLVQTSIQAPSDIASIKVSSNGSASHLALSKNLDSAIPNDRGILKDKTKLIAFYLPQFHQTKENSEWWGPGFTEWTNAANGKPNFKGHYQPHIPRELGFYDLQNVEVMRAQADLAKTYGVHGFCFYYYWFSGRRILERPLDNFLASNIDMPFCLCWANENWTRTWDGDEKSVLLEQGYADGDEEKFIDDILPFLKDSRCIKVGDKPLLLVYRIKQLPDPIKSIKKWRAAALLAGLPGLHISVVDFYDISDPREVGADALVEFPPHKFNGPNNHPHPMPEFTNPSFAGGMIDYKKVVTQSKSRPQPDFPLYRGIIPGWDNTARRQDTPTTIIHNTPELYGEWLSYLRGYSRAAHLNDSSSMIFVNAWNEWGEGCHLEPDLHWGLAFLEETLRSSWYDVENDARNEFKS